MKNFFLVTLLLSVSAPAFASDSLWLLCKGTGTTISKDEHGNPLVEKSPLVINLYDSRFEADKRKDTLTWIFGGRQFTGTVIDLEMIMNRITPASDITFTEGEKAIFQGKVAVALKERGTVLTLTGQVKDSFDADGELAKYSARIVCETLN